VVPVNALPLAYAMPGSIRQWNVLTCCIVLTGENVSFAGRRRRPWHPKIEFPSKKVSEAIRYVRCVNYRDRRVIIIMFVHISGMQ